MRFNPSAKPKRPAPDTVNESGGAAYSKSSEQVLLNILLNSKVTSDIKSSDDIVSDLESAVLDCELPFIMKAGVYARHVIGNRSITHILCALVLKHFKSPDIDAKIITVRDFINAMIKTPNDAMEIFSYYVARYGHRPIPNALKRGVRDAFTRFSSYQIAKYKKTNNATSLRDLMRLFHPNSTEQTETALSQLAAGTLKGAVTAQSILAKGGDKEENNQELADLLISGKLGYSALIFNFVRFFTMGIENAAAEAILQLTDRERIEKSLETPLRYYTLYKAFESHRNEMTKHYYTTGLNAINKAMEISVDNIPYYKGKNVFLAHDISGSMAACIEIKHGKTTTQIRRDEIAAVFMAAWIKSKNKVTYSRFDDTLHLMTDTDLATLRLEPMMNVINKIRRADDCTNFTCIFKGLNDLSKIEKNQDIIILMTDDQSWMHGNNGVYGMLTKYRQLTLNKTVRLVLWDIAAGNTTSAFPESDPYASAIYGWSDKVFEAIRNTSKPGDMLLKEINAINLNDYVKRGKIVKKAEPEPEKKSRKKRAKEVNLRVKRFRPKKRNKETA